MPMGDNNKYHGTGISDDQPLLASSKPPAAESSGVDSAAACGPNQQHSQQHSAVAAAVAAAASHYGTTQPQGVPCGCSEDDEDAVMQAAWRWRFTRRWQAEQSRVVDPAAPSSMSDGMDEALLYLHACGENWHLARTTSTDLLGTHETRMLGTLGTPSLLTQDMLVDESSFSGSKQRLLGGCSSTGLSREPSLTGAGAGGAATATREVLGITKRAAQLLKAQDDIDKVVSERCGQPA